MIKIEFDKEKMNYKLDLEAKREYNNYCEEWLGDYEEDLINDGYELEDYKFDFLLDDTKNILNNMYDEVSNSGVVDTEVLENILNQYKFNDKEAILLRIERSSYDDNSVEICLFNEKNKRWYWLDVDLEKPINCKLDTPIPKGTYKATKIEYFEMD